MQAAIERAIAANPTIAPARLRGPINLANLAVAGSGFIRKARSSSKRKRQRKPPAWRYHSSLVANGQALRHSSLVCLAELKPLGVEQLASHSSHRRYLTTLRRCFKAARLLLKREALCRISGV